MKRNKKRNHKRNNKFNNTGFYCQNTLDKVVITKHVRDRLRLRMQREDLTDKEIDRIIKQHIKQSRLIDIKRNEEHHSYFGYVYVCKREKGPLQDKLHVITLKLSNIKKKQHFSRNFDTKTIEYESMDVKII